METRLVVVSPFADYAVGTVISDPAKVEELRGQRDKVVPVSAAALPSAEGRVEGVAATASADPEPPSLTGAERTKPGKLKLTDSGGPLANAADASDAPASKEA